MDCMELSFVFFSSRRRHTRYWRDWSSDVCSSDLTELKFYDILICNKYHLFRSMFLLELFVLAAIVLGSEPQSIVLVGLIVYAVILAIRMSNTSESKKQEIARW